MKNTKTYSKLWPYVLLFVGVFAVDRVTKYVALSTLAQPRHLTSWLTFELTFNRGVSWGMLHTENPLFFLLLTLAIVFMITFLGGYALARWRQGFYIVGETLALSGAASNIIDRFFYGGVVDFIVFVVNGCAPFGVFNIADVCIVCGIFLMFFCGLQRE